MRFNRELKPWGAWLLLALMLVLSLRYLREPERQMFGTPLGQWGSGLAHLVSGSAADANLEAQTQLLTYGQPLIEYEGLNFLGCDFALNQGQAELVTYWNDMRPDVNYAAQLRLHMLSTQSVIEYTQPITASTLYWSLPKGYYSELQRGDIWLRLIEAPTGDAIKPLLAVPHAAGAGWLQICAS